MAESIDENETSVLAISILLDGSPANSQHLVESIYIMKEVNKISYAKCTILESDAFNDSFEVSNSSDYAPGKTIEIKLGYDTSTKTVFKGIITSHGLRLNNKKSLISIECRDEAIKLTAGRKNAVFEDSTDSDIIQKIIQAAGVECKVDTTTVVHSEVVQHYCSDWDFLMMRAETNGLMVVTNNGKLEVKKPELSGAPELEVIYGENMISFSADIDARHQFSSVVSTAWDISKQALVTSTSKKGEEVEVGNLTTASLANVLGSKEYLMQSSVHMSPEALEVWASAKQLKSNLTKLKGKVDFAGNSKVMPCSLLKLSGLSQRFNGNAFVGAVEQLIENGVWKTTAHLGTSFDWYTQETSMIDAPAASGLVAPFKGLAIGIVKQIHEDKDGQYRVKVAFPTLQSDNLSVWARLSSFYATKEAGAFFFPEISDEVVVGFLNEDPQHPIIMGMLYSSGNKTPFPPEQKNKIKSIVTKNKLTLQFDDEDKIIEIHTPKKNKIQLNDKEDQIMIVDSNNNKFLLSKDGIVIETEKDFTVKAKGKINLEATADISLKATGDLKGEGLNVTMEGKTKFAAKGAMAEVNGSGQTTIKGGMVMIN
jgi:Rhs element Vgr protein